ncbi:MAG TPA: hypothetical protein VFK86_11015 [Bauldia sp.]|nr:hypothetical protein [Bauldia sp.]
MRYAVLAVLLLSAAPSVAFAATDDELRQQIVGAWGTDAACTDASLVFNADGTFAMVEPGQDAASQRGGTWSIKGGILSGATPEGAMPDVTVRIEETKLLFEEGGQVVNELTRCAS